MRTEDGSCPAIMTLMTLSIISASDNDIKLCCFNAALFSCMISMIIVLTLVLAWMPGLKRVNGKLIGIDNTHLSFFGIALRAHL